MFFWTETPLAEMWRQLRYLRSPANVKNLLIGKTKSGRTDLWPDTPDTDAQGYAISACIRQAEEYYLASGQVGFATEPLLQYYGALSLAKAICLASEPVRRLDQLNYHGLKAPKPWDNTSPTRDVEDRAAVVDEGVFRVLCTSVGEESIPPKGTRISLREILSVIPELAELYSRHYGEPSCCVTNYSIEDDKGYMIMTFRNIEHEKIMRIFPEFSNGFTTVLQENKVTRFRSNVPVTSPLRFLKSHTGEAGGSYLVRVLPNGPNSAFCKLFCALFILSDLVRYRPDFWMKILEGTDTGSATMLEALSGHAKRQMPHQTLEFIWKEKFTFGMSSYWG